MISELDREVQIHRMRGLLTAADRIVWSKSSFPAEHRPDVAGLSSGIKIGTNIDNNLEPHPQMRPEVVVSFQASAQRAKTVSDKIAWYDISTRQMVFNPILAGNSDEKVRRIIYHEAASDISDKQELVSRDQFTDEEISRVEEVISAAFPDDNPFSIDQVYMIKSGFKKYIMAEGFLISMFFTEEVDNLDEIYPTIHEIVTDQIYRRGGDIEYFDSDARNGHLRIVGLEGHQNFARMLFRVLTVIDWRDLLTAFKTGNIEDALDVLEDKAVDPDYGAGILMELFEAMKHDEELIERANRALGASFSDLGWITK